MPSTVVGVPAISLHSFSCRRAKYCGSTRRPRPNLTNATTIDNCRPKVPKEPYKPDVPWKEALEWVELEYVILQARYDGLSFQEIAELTE